MTAHGAVLAAIAVEERAATSLADLLDVMAGNHPEFRAVVERYPHLAERLAAFRVAKAQRRFAAALAGVAALTTPPTVEDLEVKP